MNEENIKDVIERLRKLAPEKVNMAAFWSRRTSCACHGNWTPVDYLHFKQDFEDCGTAACLAGWIKFWYRDTPYICTADTLAITGEVLGIRPFVVVAICYNDNWSSIDSLKVEYPEWEKKLTQLQVLIVLLSQLVEGRLKIKGTKVYDNEQQVDDPNALQVLHSSYPGTN